MYVVEVLPISRGVFKDRLSYFTANPNVTLGSLVTVPVRSRKVIAIVTSLKDVREEKAVLKQESFSLRKIENLKGKPLLSEHFLGAALDTAQFFAGSVGSVLSTFIPKAVLDSPQGLFKPPADNKKTDKKVVRETLVLQASDDERFGEYKSLIRERFARGLSVFLCFPTTHEVDDLLTSLDRGIRDYSFVLHGGLPRAKIVSTWKAVLAEEHPVLIVGTGTFLSIPRADLGTIILERESSRYYKSSKRPYPDVRVFAEFLAKRRGLELILGDIALRVETLHKVEENIYAEYGASLKFRLLWAGAYKIVDMRAKSNEKSLSKFEILSPELKSVISGLRNNTEKLFLFTSRRGLAPLTFCGDCQTVVTCMHCSAPITLHRGSSRSFFLCHHCGDKRSTEERCRVCGSWKLQTLGIGIESVEEVIGKEFPDVPLFRLDKDTAETNKKALEIANKFYESKSSILLGTEVALYYLREGVENSGVVSIDSLFSLPDFRINERIFHMLLTLRAKTEKKFIIQTRNIEAAVLGFAATGSINDFYKEEMEIREKFGYPPFSTLIKITIEGSETEIEREIEDLQKHLSGEELEIFPAFIATVKGRGVMNALLKIRNGAWPASDLSAKLAALPPHFKVHVDPESIL